MAANPTGKNDDQAGAGDQGQVASVIDALYKHFLLRDLFAKIVPGLGVLLAITYDNPIGTAVADLGGSVGWPVALVIAGAAWIVGFAVQDIGEAVGIIQHQPPRYKNSDLRYDARIAFSKVASASERKQVERYAIIKEAAGNGATAIFLIVGILTTRVLAIDRARLDAATIGQHLFLLGVGTALWHTNYTHARKHYKFIDRVLGQNDASFKAPE